MLWGKLLGLVRINCVKKKIIPKYNVIITSQNGTSNGIALAHIVSLLVEDIPPSESFDRRMKVENNLPIRKEFLLPPIPIGKSPPRQPRVGTIHYTPDCNSQQLLHENMTIVGFKSY